MKVLSKRAKAIFMALVTNDDGTRLNSARTIGKDGGAIMAVHVERIGTCQYGPIYSVAHYYKQNGDMICDPDMTFLLADNTGEVMPLTWEMGGLRYDVAVEIREDGSFAVRHKLLASITTFANQWMANIKEQQDIKPIRAKAVA